MKKNYFSIIGFIILMAFNYILNNYFDQELSKNSNDLSFYKILKESLLPPAVFMLFIFFTRKYLKATIFSLIIIGYMIVEFIFRYFNGKEAIEYNYLIGTILGLAFIFIVEWLKQRFVDNK